MLYTTKYSWLTGRSRLFAMRECDFLASKGAKKQGPGSRWLKRHDCPTDRQIDRPESTNTHKLATVTKFLLREFSAKAALLNFLATPRPYVHRKNVSPCRTHRPRALRARHTHRVHFEHRGLPRLGIQTPGVFVGKRDPHQKRLRPTLGKWTTTRENSQFPFSPVGAQLSHVVFSQPRGCLDHNRVSHLPPLLRAS